MTQCTTLMVTELPSQGVQLPAGQSPGNFLGCQHTRPGHVQPLNNQHTQVLLSRAALDLLLAQPGLIPGVAPDPGAAPTPGCVELHQVPLLALVQIPLDAIPNLWMPRCPSGAPSSTRARLLPAQRTAPSPASPSRARSRFPLPLLPGATARPRALIPSAAGARSSPRLSFSGARNSWNWAQDNWFPWELLQYRLNLPLRCLPCQGPSSACSEVPSTAWLFRADFFPGVAAPVRASPRAPLRLLPANSRGSAAWQPRNSPGTAAGTGTGLTPHSHCL